MDNKFYYEKLKLLRKQHHLTQQELAEKLSVVRLTITDWERGKKEPSIQTLIKIANIFNCDVAEFFKSKTTDNISNKISFEHYLINNYDLSFFTKRKYIHFVTDLEKYIKYQCEIAKITYKQNLLQPITPDFYIAGTYKQTNKLVFTDNRDKNNEKVYILGELINGVFEKCQELDTTTLEIIPNLYFSIKPLTKNEGVLNEVYNYKITPDFSKYNKE